MLTNFIKRFEIFMFWFTLFSIIIILTAHAMLNEWHSINDIVLGLFAGSTIILTARSRQ